MIGFIGSGKMGIPMAGNLLANGEKLAVYARSPAKAEPLIAVGASPCESIAELATDCNIIFTILGGPEDVEELYLGKAGLVLNAGPGTILIDMTTSSPQLAKKLHQKGLEASIRVLNAPVTGGVPAAETGKLCFMVGGDRDALASTIPLLKLMGNKIIHMGKAGAGQTAKACNQIAVAGILLGMSEALSLASSDDIDTEKVFEALNSGTASSTLMSRIGRKMLDGDTSASFTASHFIKDLQIATNIAARHGKTIYGADYCRKLCETLDPDSGLQDLISAAIPKDNPGQD